MARCAGGRNGIPQPSALARGPHQRQVLAGACKDVHLDLDILASHPIIAVARSENCHIIKDVSDGAMSALIVSGRPFNPV